MVGCTSYNLSQPLFPGQGRRGIMSQPHFALRGEVRGDVFAVHVDGQELRLDEAHTQTFAVELCGLAQASDRPELLVDLANVAALTTPALVALGTLRRQLLTQGRRLALCNLQPVVAEVLEISKLSRLFPIYRAEVARRAPAAPAPRWAGSAPPRAPPPAPPHPPDPPP